MSSFNTFRITEFYYPIYSCELRDHRSRNPIKKHIVMEWIFGFFAEKEHPIQKYKIYSDKIFDSITKKCIESDKEIMGIQHVCAASPDNFQSIKS